MAVASFGHFSIATSPPEAAVAAVAAAAGIGAPGMCIAAVAEAQ